MIKSHEVGQELVIQLMLVTQSASNSLHRLSRLRFEIGSIDVQNIQK